MKMLTNMSPVWALSHRSLSPNLMGDMFDDFDRIVDGFLQPSLKNTVRFQPSCDIRETKDHYVVSMDMPGVKKDDVKIEIQSNQLLISGERRYSSKEEVGESTLRHERAYGKFERTFTLPSTINAEKIEAHYEDGVLSVALPKVEVATGRTIEIQTGKEGFFSKLLGTKKEGSKEMKDVKTS
jgi:HSP20 family protein